jgi:hypothetical protein
MCQNFRLLPDYISPAEKRPSHRWISHSLWAFLESLVLRVPSGMKRDMIRREIRLLLVGLA